MSSEPVSAHEDAEAWLRCEADQAHSRVHASALRACADRIEALEADEHPATDYAWEVCHAMESALQRSGEPMQVFPSEQAWEKFEEWRKRA